jgi:hypothetical protein
MAEFQFRLEVKPLLKWDKWVGKVRKYSESKANSIDILTIIGRYSKSVREFYEWFWLKIDEKMKPERVECHAHVRELMAYGEEVFLVLAGHAVSIVDPDDSNRCEDGVSGGTSRCSGRGSSGRCGRRKSGQA